MKSFLLVAASLASVDAVCYSAGQCAEEVRCEVVIPHNPPIDCWFPHIRRACCNAFQVTMTCNENQNCMSRHMQTWPGAELQWMVNHQNVANACPGLQALERDIQYNVQQYCHLTGEEDLDAVKDSMHQFIMQGEFAIMTAQQPEPPAELKSSLMPGMLGCAFGAAVVTAVVAMKKKRTSTDYLLCDETA